MTLALTLTLHSKMYGVQNFGPHKAAPDFWNPQMQKNKIVHTYRRKTEREGETTILLLRLLGCLNMNHDFFNYSYPKWAKGLMPVGPT